MHTRWGMLSNDQRKLLTTGIAVVVGCALAWYLLVDRNPPKQQVQVARQLKRPEAKERKQRPGAVASNEEEQPRPLPPPTPVIKPRPNLANLPPLEPGNTNPASQPSATAIPEEEVDPQT